MNLEALTTDQLDNLLVERQKEMQRAEADLNEVELRRLDLEKEIAMKSREIHRIVGDKKDIEVRLEEIKRAEKTARYNLKQLSLDIAIITRTFWQKKRG